MFNFKLIQYLTEYIENTFKEFMNSSQNIASSLKSFNILQKLGEGSFASVYKVQRIDNKKVYAMKKVIKMLLKGKNQRNEIKRKRQCS